MRATRAVIHLENLKYNIEQIKKKFKAGVRICLPVKADAYGHGAVQIALCALHSGVFCLAVASVREAVLLREAGITAPVILLSLPVPEETEQLIRYDIIPLVIDEECIDALNDASSQAGKKTAVHLKIDTGMSRIGCAPENAVQLAKRIQNSSNLKLDGVCTHFSVSDSFEKDDREYTKKQIADFKNTVKAIQNAGIDTGIVHASNSGAVLAYPEAQFDMVRPGLLCYGYTPYRKNACKTDQNTEKSFFSSIKLRPVMELLTKVVFIKKIAKGTAVSYGRSWTANQDTYIATLPIGYADGLSRTLSPALRVKIAGSFYPVIGKICMDQCMVDLGSHTRVKRWDDVCIFGPENKAGANNSAQDIADIADTIPYEIMCNINKRVDRIYTE